MTKSKRITPQEWIQDYFSPLVSVMTGPEVDRVCAKNNLTFTELVQPFSKLLVDITVKDPEGINHSVPSLNVNFQDFKKDPSRLVNQKLMSDLVSDCSDEPLVSRTFSNNVSLEAPGFTPWFDNWTKLYLSTIPAMDHEFLRHHVGTVYAVSSSSANPLEEFRNLNDKNHKHHHEKPSAYPQFLANTLMKYYVLVHDVYECKENRAQEIFTQMQNSFGSTNCHLLQINSRTVATDSEKANPAMVDYWLGRSNNRFSNVDTRREGMGLTVINTAASAASLASNNAKGTNEISEPNKPSVVGDFSHPLAMDDKPDSPPPPILNAEVKLTPVTKSNIATYLTSNDIDRVRIFVREFCIKGLVPFVEKQMRTLNEVITTRKNRSFLSGAKRWFGQNKAGTPGTSVVYSKEAPELQIRKLGDLYFMLNLYKLAYNCYHTCKKDFLNDEAWNYYSGASEMSALSLFMMNDPTKKYSTLYMEDAVTKYLQVCQMPEFAVRTTIFDALCLKYQGLFLDAANRYIKMTNDSKDLRSSLFYEQAAYCFLLSTPPSIRKFGFHIILSGYRFSKAGQKRHSARAYKQGYQVYKDQGWALSQDHILYNMGHQSLLLKDHATATALFNDLLSMPQPNPNALQQMCHLREFFIVHHMREKERKGEVAEISVPDFEIQNCVLDLGHENKPYDALKTTQQVAGPSWQSLERIVAERIQGQEILFLSKSCQDVFTPNTSNNLRPQAVVGEHVRLLIPVRNKFLTTFELKKVSLLWRFSGNENLSEPLFNSGENLQDTETFVRTDVIDSLIIEANSTVTLDIGITVMQPGELIVTGVEYGLKAQFPQSENYTDYTVRGKQAFFVKGPRLHGTKEQKTSVFYGPDFRLTLDVGETQPILEAKINFPEVILQGEIKCLELSLTNAGSCGMKNLYLVSQHPGMLSFENSQRSGLFDFPLVKDSDLMVVKENGESVMIPMDFVPLHSLTANGVIGPGKTIKVPIWFRGPDRMGPIEIKTLCYFESDVKVKKRPLYRMVSLRKTVKVLPSIIGSASWCGECCFVNHVNEMLVLHLTNIRKAGGGHHDDSGDILVSQVCLISTDSVLKGLQSRNGHANTFSKTDSISLGFQVQKNRRDAQQQDKVRFSSVKCSNVKGFRCDASPCVDFVKPNFVFNDHKKAPALDKDTLAVFWHEPKHNLNGMAIIPISPLVAHPKKADSDVVDGNESNFLASNESPNFFSVPCSVTLDMDVRKSHDFRSSRVCVLPCKLKVRNTEKHQSTRLFVKVDNSENPDCQIVGCMNAEIIMPAGSEIVLNFSISVSCKGLFQCKGLLLQTGELRSHEINLKRTYVPIEICFSVD